MGRHEGRTPRRVVFALFIVVSCCSYVWAGTATTRIVSGSFSFTPGLGNSNLGVFSDDYFPSPRDVSAIWRSPMYPDLIWLQGGLDSGANPQNDQWVFSLSRQQWAFQRSGGQCRGVFGQPSAASYIGPIGQTAAIVTKGQPDMAFILFGYVPGTTDYMWSFNMTSQYWTWWGGSYQATSDDAACSVYTYVSAGYSTSNKPGGRRAYGALLSPFDDSVWIFAGSGSSPLHDLWSFQPNLNVNPYSWRIEFPRQGNPDWRSSGGCYYYDYYSPVSLYSESTQGPNGRRYPTMMADQTQPYIMWMFGGEGWRQQTAQPFILQNELWRFNMSSGLWAWFGGAPDGYDTQTSFGTKDVWSTGFPPNAAPNYPAFFQIPSQPGIFYFFGGGTGGTTIWAFVARDTFLGSAPKWVWIGGQTLGGQAPPMDSSAIGGPFNESHLVCSTNTGFSVPSPENPNFLVQKVASQTTAGGYYSVVHELNLMSVTWPASIIAPPTNRRWDTPLTVRVAILPTQFTSPVGGFRAWLEEATGSVVLLGNTTMVVNGWANFTDLVIVDYVGNLRLRIFLEAVRIEDSFSPSFFSQCSYGCTASSCNAMGLAFPTQCTLCDNGVPGYVVNKDNTMCVTVCDPHTYKKLSSPARCVDCTAGCLNCTGPGLTAACSRCDEDLGYTRDASSCVTVCPVGKYNDKSTPGSHQCTVCGTPCVECSDSGSFCPRCNTDAGYGRTQAGECVNPCPSGLVRDEVTFMCAGVQCVVPNVTVAPTDCPGTAVDYGDSCNMWCPDGTFGQVTAVTCGQTASNGPGVFIGVPPCTPCPAGTFGKSGDQQCTKCPNGFTRTTGNSDITACLCSEGYYDGEQIGDCIPCPTGAYCASERARPVAALGYYEVADAYVQCAPTRACLGNNLCDTGFYDFLCAKCVKGYYRYNGDCLECKNDTAWKIIVFAIVGSLACLFLVFVAIPHEHETRGYASASIPIALAFIQITAAFIDIKLHWPPQVVDFFVAFSTLNFNLEIVNPECVINFTYFEKLQIQLLIPIAIFALFILNYVPFAIINHLRYKTREPGSSLRHAKHLAFKFGAGFLLFLSLAYLFMAQTTLAFFSCKRQPDGTYTLVGSPADACYGPDWNATFPLAITGVVLYVIMIPILNFGVYLWISRWHGRVVARSHPLLNFAIVKYRPAYFWWENVVVVRKLGIVLIGTFVVDDPINSAVLASMVLLVSVLLVAIVRPFTWNKHDVIDGISMVTSLLVLFLGILGSTQTATPEQRGVFDTVAVVAIACTCTLLALVFILEMIVKLRAYRVDRHDFNLCGTWPGHRKAVTGMLLHEEQIITGDARGELRRWSSEPTSKAEVIALNTYSDGIVCLVAVPKDESVFIAAFEETGFMVLRHPTNETLSSTKFPESLGTLRRMTVAGGKLCTYHSGNGVYTLATWTFPLPDAETPTVILHGSYPLTRDVSAMMGSGSTLNLSIGVMIEAWEINNDPAMVRKTGEWKTTHRRPVDALAVRDDTLFITLGLNVQAINVAEGVATANFPGQFGEACFAHVEGMILFVGCYDGGIRVYDLNTNQFIQRCMGHHGRITSLVAGPEVIYAGSAVGDVYAWPRVEYRAVASLDPFTAWYHRWWDRRQSSAAPPGLELRFMRDTANESNAATTTPLLIEEVDERDNGDVAAGNDGALVVMTAEADALWRAERADGGTAAAVEAENSTPLFGTVSVADVSTSSRALIASSPSTKSLVASPSVKSVPVRTSSTLSAAGKQ